MPTQTRRQFLWQGAAAVTGRSRRPNILLALSDDHSFPHVSAAGDPVVKTPAFDRVARSGVRFLNGFCPAPGCAPSRAALLTSRNIWQLEEAGTHASLFPKKWPVYTEVLAEAGYFVGLTGKGAGPCNYADAGWKHNPAGPAFDDRKIGKTDLTIRNLDYAANFQDFLRAKPADQPFCFWFGCSEPHRAYALGSGRRAGMDPARVAVPGFLPDEPEIRSDILDYYLEIQHFDAHLGKMLEILEAAGELENTLIVVSGDNGMPFPRAKANLYEFGIHPPMAIAWAAGFQGNREVEDLVTFIDFGPTFYEAAGVRAPRGLTGRSLLPVLKSGKSGQVDPAFTQIVSGRERHSHARFDNLGYPCRALRTPEYLYIRNFKPDLWPAGDPPGYHDIDDSPSKRFMLERQDRLFELGFGKRPAEELYEVRRDPACIENVAVQPEHASTLRRLRGQLERTLKAQGDPRMGRRGAIFDSYPRFSAMRPELGGFAEQGQYNPKFRR